MAALTIARTDREWPPVIAIGGVLNVRTAAPCLDRVAERVDGSFVLDLSGVYVCDPAGASALVDLSTKILQQGHRCVFAAPSYAVARVLRITGIARMVSIASTAAAARQSLRRGAASSGAETNSSSGAETARERNAGPTRT